MPWECVNQSSGDKAELTKARMQELISVNKKVNNSIEPVTDAEHFGVAERWSYPDDQKVTAKIMYS